MKTTWLHWKKNAENESRTRPMVGTLVLGGSIATLLAAVAYAAKPETRTTPVEANRAEAASIIREALDSSPASPDDARFRLVKAAEEAAKRLGTDSLIAQDLLRAAEQAKQSNSDVPTVRKAFEKAHQTLTFQPLMEAELPRGYPVPGPLGEIRVKQYPAYRMAVSKSGSSAFWSLFSHIKRHDIAMTAPVEMSYGKADESKPSEQSMAFLYGDPDMGQTGPDGNVEVVDAEPVTVVSIGLNGSRSETRIEQARDQLLNWLAESSQYEVVGPMRVLGYNSPFVPRDRKYWEVQIPVR